MKETVINNIVICLVAISIIIGVATYSIIEENHRHTQTLEAMKHGYIQKNIGYGKNTWVKDDSK